MTNKSPWRTIYRIEPDPRAVNPIAGAEAPIGDPLWLLGRQWWMGEMAFFDGGTPLQGSVAHSTESLVAETMPGVASEDLLPSQTLAEPLGDPKNVHWRESLRLAQGLLSYVEENTGVAAGMVERLADHLAILAPLSVSHPVVRRAPENRRIDGAQVLAMTRARTLDISNDLRGLVSEWAARQPSDSGGGLDRDTRQHFAGFQGSGGSRIKTSRARGPALHWSDLDGDAVKIDGTVKSRPLTRVSVPGTQPHRWWRFEDDTLDWTAAPAGPSDLGQLLIAASFAEQGQLLWQCSVEVPTNTLARVMRVTYTDTFGIGRDVENAQNDTLRGWSLADGTFPVLAAAPILEGPPLERAALRTDPTDNLAWLEETIRRDRDGRGTDWRPAPRFDDQDEPSVVLRKAPPENWRAYGVEDNGLIVLPFEGQDQHGATGFAMDRFQLRPSQIGARGMVYRLTPVLGRTAAGHRVAWQVAVGRIADRPAGSSGLRHDTIERPTL